MTYDADIDDDDYYFSGDDVPAPPVDPKAVGRTALAEARATLAALDERDNGRRSFRR